MRSYTKTLYTFSSCINDVSNQICKYCKDPVLAGQDADGYFKWHKVCAEQQDQRSASGVCQVCGINNTEILGRCSKCHKNDNWNYDKYVGPPA